jgi:hypothetical protein
MKTYHREKLKILFKEKNGVLISIYMPNARILQNVPQDRGVQGT